MRPRPLAEACHDVCNLFERLLAKMHHSPPEQTLCWCKAILLTKPNAYTIRLRLDPHHVGRGEGDLDVGPKQTHTHITCYVRRVVVYADRNTRRYALGSKPWVLPGTFHYCKKLGGLFIRAYVRHRFRLLRVQSVFVGPVDHCREVGNGICEGVWFVVWSSVSKIDASMEMQRLDNACSDTSLRHDWGNLV